MPLSFSSVSPFDCEDVRMLARVLRLLLEQCAPSWPPPAAPLVSRAYRALAGDLRAALSSPSPPVSGEDAPGRVVGIPTERLLDAAAYLLDASQLLHRHGLPVDALVLEGVEGRLMEAAVGAGRVELSA